MKNNARFVSPITCRGLLKGFQKVHLDPGATRRVEIALPPAALAFYDVSARKWKTEAGRYEVQVGTSSRDIRLRSTVQVAEARYHERF